MIKSSFFPGFVLSLCLSVTEVSSVWSWWDNSVCHKLTKTVAQGWRGRPVTLRLVVQPPLHISRKKHWLLKQQVSYLDLVFLIGSFMSLSEADGSWEIRGFNWATCWAAWWNCGLSWFLLWCAASGRNTTLHNVPLTAIVFIVTPAQLF